MTAQAEERVLPQDQTRSMQQRIDAALATFRQVGGWLEPPADRRPPLVGQVSADVVVAGGGFAGLSTALELAGKGMRVVLLERDFCGFGASGRNAGYLAGGQGVKFGLFLRRLGEDAARDIVSFYQEGVDYVESKLAEYDIDCDYIQTGLIRAAVHPSQEAKLRKSSDLSSRFGAPSTFLDSAAMRARGIPPAFVCGTYSPNGGTLQPGKYVLGLRRAAIEAGVQIYEDSPLVSYDEGKTISCRTPKGAARGRFLVLATNAYTPQVGLLGRTISPIKVSAIESEPLTSDQLGAIGWRGREGIVTPHVTMESHRLTVDNRLVITTKRVDYLYGLRTPNTPDNRAYRALVRSLYERFPMLGDVPLRACWSGYMSLASDGVPVVGETGAHKNILYSAGCNGHGVGTQSLVGRLLARRIEGVEDPLLAGLRHKTPKVPPEPARWIGMQAALRSADFLDSRVDRKIRRQNPGADLRN